MKIQTHVLVIFFVTIFCMTASAQNAFMGDTAQTQLAQAFSFRPVGEWSTTSYNQSGATSDYNDSRWRVDLTPYLWLAGQSGDVLVRNIEVRDIDISFSDVLEDLDMGFAGHLEATRNQWTILFDLNYVNISDKPNTVIVRLKNLTTEIGATYHITDAFEFLGGARIVRYKIELTPDQLSPREDSKTWVDGFAGLRASARVGESFVVSGRGDIGGFGSDFSWNIILDGSYRIAPWGSLYFAYRWWEIDFGSNDDNEFQVNILTHGPVLGLTFHF